MKPRSNMYPLSVQQLNFWVGCDFGCSYCKPSFQRQLKRWAKGKCEFCYKYQPHSHYKDRVDLKSRQLPRTKYMQFIFLNATGDIASAPTSELETHMDFVESYPDRTFLLQSKDPATFQRYIHLFPENLILGTTIETQNYILTRKISKAPDPFWRYTAMCHLRELHKQLMVTIEPVLKFHLHTMVKWMEDINPCMIWLGYDSKPEENHLPEPSLEDVKELHWELSRRGFVVILKTIRKAWWEQQP